MQLPNVVNVNIKIISRVTSNIVEHPYKKLDPVTAYFIAAGNSPVRLTGPKHSLSRGRETEASFVLTLDTPSVNVK